MSDFESFNPSGASESYDPAAFERFKEQIKKNAAFIAAARKGEQKQKQKEDRLAKILLQFIKKNQKTNIVLLAARLLEENIPASFVLAIILLGNEELRYEVKLGVPQLETSVPPQQKTTEFSLITRFNDESLPLKVKAEIDNWGKGILESGSAAPFRVLETALSKDGNVKKVVIDCAAAIISDFFEVNNCPPVLPETFFSFCEFLMHGVMQHLQKQIENQKELGGGAQ